MSVIVAMRNEADWVERCVRSLLAQDYPDLEVVLVDDRSDDQTGTRLAALPAEGGDRLLTLRVDTVPEGWGGQNHAFACAAEVATGRYLLFTDADCQLLSPRAVSVAVAEAEREDLGLLTIIPNHEAPSWFERAYLPTCGFVYLHGLEIGHVNDPRHPAGFGFGPFLLLRRDVYDGMGGHERVRGLINGDVAFGRIAKAEGVPCRVVGNRGLASTRMYTSVAKAWAGWTRNFYNSIQRPSRLLAGAGVSGGFLVAPWGGLALTLAASLAEPAWWPAAASFAAVLVLAQVAMVRIVAAMPLPLVAALLYPPGACFVTALSLRAAWRALARRPTRWHGLTYAAPELVPPRTRGPAPCYSVTKGPDQAAA